MKKIILSIVGAIVVLVGGIGGYLAYENHQQAVAQAQADKWYQNDFQNDSNVKSASTNDLSFNEVKSILKQQIGKDFTPDQAKTLISGWTVVPIHHHQYVFRKGKDADYLVVTFNADETSVVKVEVD